MWKYYKNKKALFILDDIDDLILSNQVNNDVKGFLTKLEAETNINVKFILISNIMSKQNIGLNEIDFEVKPLLLEDATNMILYWSSEYLTYNYGADLQDLLKLQILTPKNILWSIQMIKKYQNKP